MVKYASQHGQIQHWSTWANITLFSVDKYNFFQISQCLLNIYYSYQNGHNSCQTKESLQSSDQR